MLDDLLTTLYVCNLRSVSKLASLIISLEISCLSASGPVSAVFRMLSQSHLHFSPYAVLLRSELRESQYCLRQGHYAKFAIVMQPRCERKIEPPSRFITVYKIPVRVAGSGERYAYETKTPHICLVHATRTAAVFNQHCADRWVLITMA